MRASPSVGNFSALAVIETSCRNMVGKMLSFSPPEVSVVAPDLTELLLFSFFAGYGGYPYGVQHAGLTPEATSAGQHSNVF